MTTITPDMVRTVTEMMQRILEIESRLIALELRSAEKESDK